MNELKKINAIFYKNSLGKEPVKEWLINLQKEERKLIGNDIRTVEYGWPIGMPVCRPLGHGLYEVRTNLSNTIARVIFAIIDDTMLLLHGIIKKQQKTPINDLNTARRRLKEATK